ncbi:hypothetical protein GOODEAATRI_022240 [Goodea atripinnis]|uniref:Gypsy retrotransposon integrase-like protein 1 n=1 Tax=Goodea atripinnis TaxID=208336 RepID=A0ABV0NMA9_9TELE
MGYLNEKYKDPDMDDLLDMACLADPSLKLQYTQEEREYIKERAVLEMLKGERAVMEDVIRSLHDDHSHQGVERTLQLIRSQYYWPNMYSDEDVIRSLHDDHSHQGVERTLQLIRSRYYWPNMYSDKRKWPRHISHVTFAYNTTVHQSTGMTPYFLMFGRKPQLSVDFFFYGIE